VRCGNDGDVYDEYGPARDHYHGLQHLGLHPVLAVRQSLTAAVSFIEERSGHGAHDSAQRSRWIREELRARAAAGESSSGEWEESDLTGSETVSKYPRLMLMSVFIKST
jgi:hypothetical protein